MTDTTSRFATPIASATATVLGARSMNNDRAYADATTAIVIDGVGDEWRGSQTATVALSGALAALNAASLDDPQRASVILEGARSALAALGDRAGQATITVLALSGGAELLGHLAWLGDSPAYVLRDEILQQVTRPHNQAQELAERSLLGFANLYDSPLAHRLTRGLVGDPHPPETLTVKLRPDDRLLVASDGLLAVPLEDVGWALAQGDDALRPAACLVRTAVEHGARDNTTVATITLGVAREIAAGTIDVPVSAVSAVVGIPSAQWNVESSPRKKRQFFPRRRDDPAGSARDTAPLPDL